MVTLNHLKNAIVSLLSIVDSKIKNDIQSIKNEIKQADWLVNDENDFAYIKNRPFYENIRSTENLIFEHVYENPTGERVGIMVSSEHSLVNGEKYDVEYNGVLYEDLVCSGMAIGSSYDEVENNTGEYPFRIGRNSSVTSSVIMDVDTYGAIGEDRHVKVTQKSAEMYIEPIDSKYLPEHLQFGEGIETIIDDSFSDFEEWDSNIYGTSAYRICDYFVDGQSYAVIWDGVLYENLICYNYDGGQFIGSTYNEIMDGNNKYPFGICTYDDGGVVVVDLFTSDASNTSHTIKVIAYPITPLDVKYLPEHLQFGTNVSEVEIMPETTFAFTVNGNGHLNASYNESKELVVGKKYTVIYDGIEYKDLICKLFYDTIPYIGAEIGMQGVDSYEIYPFAVTCMPDATPFLTIEVESGESHTVAIYEVTEEITPIDEKFLPPSLVIVEIESDDNGVVTSCSKTYDEIRELINNGVNVMVKKNGGVMSLYQMYDDGLDFCCYDIIQDMGIAYSKFHIAPDDMSYESGQWLIS